MPKLVLPINIAMFAPMYFAIKDLPTQGALGPVRRIFLTLYMIIPDVVQGANTRTPWDLKSSVNILTDTNHIQTFTTLKRIKIVSIQHLAPNLVTTLRKPLH